MIRLQFKENERQRKWRKAFTKYDTPEAFKMMRNDALVMVDQDGWSSWRIVKEDTGKLLYGPVVSGAA